MKLLELTSFLETIAPLAYQEEYDNSGLIIGNPNMHISGALISLDCTEVIVDEAIECGFNLIISGFSRCAYPCAAASEPVVNT